MLKFQEDTPLFYISKSYFSDEYFSCVFMTFIGYEQFNDSYFSWIFMTCKDKEGHEVFLSMRANMKSKEESSGEAVI